MIELKMLAGPVIGAVIGYCTNWLAVKMLFRPRYPKYIFGHRLPFTPGIVPKGKSRLAAAVGGAVGDQLLNRETMKEVLLSEKIKNTISNEVESIIEKIAAEEAPLQEMLGKIVGEDKTRTAVEKTEQYVSERIRQNVLAMNVGDIVAEKLAEAVLEKVKGTMLAMMVSDKLVNSLKHHVSEGIGKYAEENIGTISDAIVRKECDELLQKPTAEYGVLIAGSSGEIAAAAVKAYEKILDEKLDLILEAVDFNGIARDRINSMPVEEVEALAMSVMKKELGAIVNLGALIGFILGLFNMFFYN